MREWSAEQIAQAAGAELVRGAAGSPQRVEIDSRVPLHGALFAGLVGEHVDGGVHAAAALQAGAWGVLIGSGNPVPEGAGAVLVAEDALAALQRLATAYRRQLGATVIGVTGSTGKTSTKDILRALIAPQRATWATSQNLNTDIGLPITILSAPPQTEVIVLEMAMRGAGQIAELAAIAEPDIAVITNVGPVHLELLGSVAAIAAAKAEILGRLPAGATAVVPADEPLLDPYLRDDLRIQRFANDPLPADLELLVAGRQPSTHMLLNANAALLAARAAGVTPSGPIDVELSSLRGQRRTTRDGLLVIDDCYNANPMSMRAALDDLAASAPGRRVAVIGDMLELGPDEAVFHRQVGEHARELGIEVVVTVGPRAADAGGDHAFADAVDAAAGLPELVQPGDTVLIKASRGVGLEVVSEVLR